MGQTFYTLAKFWGRWFYALSIQGKAIRPKLAERPGGYVLACTHLSHLEPFVVSAILQRKVEWMARIEFYRHKPAAWMLHALDAFPVNRFGVPVSSIRTAIARAREGRVVGIFPEGGVARGANSVCRGGPIKRGVCLVSMRANVPIIPCVVLGTHELTKIEPWLPFRRAKIWYAFGEPIQPIHNAPNHKVARQIMSQQLSEAFARLYAELLQRYDLSENETT
jgi:1-acyl-sn-glycerol-3-phosphate acyltransferase